MNSPIALLPGRRRCGGRVGVWVGGGSATGIPSLARRAGDAVSLPVIGARTALFDRRAGTDGGGVDGAGGPGRTVPSTAARRARSAGVRVFTAASHSGKYGLGR